MKLIALLLLALFLYLAWLSYPADAGYTPKQVAAVNNLICDDDWLCELEQTRSKK